MAAYCACVANMEKQLQCFEIMHLLNEIDTVTTDSNKKKSEFLTWLK